MGHIKVHQSNESHTEKDSSRTSAICELEAGSGNEDVLDDQDICKWEADPTNPYNWSAKWKAHQVLMIASAAFTTSLGVSILSPAHSQFMEEFEVGSTVAILPLSLYVFALALGSILGGPLSETVGRYPVYIGSVLLGSLFTLGVGLSNTFTAVCVLRFLAGLCFAPPLAIAAGTINETFKPAARAIPSTIFILTPFLGPGLGGWRWTQWTMLLLAVCTIIATSMARETFHPVLKSRRSKISSSTLPPPSPLSSKIRLFATIALLRPAQMMATEPIVALICLYVACEFATLFSFFAAFPMVFQGIYGFDIENTGLVFLSIVVGCLFGAITVLLCDISLYRPKAVVYHGRSVPPEFRLYPSLIGSIGLPISLFWFGWTARADTPWIAPVTAIMLFAWGNICVFVSTAQYIVDTYHGSTVASAMSANSLARYGLAAAFPLFTVQASASIRTPSGHHLKRLW
ncbi:uncharacterized protein N7477_009047 [Penicillium maclennaniae]|uniref:uncharacterized protein n=1 Tax=Penicillium maclennaniae TaxID=1343394 RepID=UPI002541B636|nr:uncharacterized protein N7477_009047 [Penicillium maclennaniae]KAJ5661431.1 hypothetical protein N7477_009047 [Penicillium maclennaniae]